MDHEFRFGFIKVSVNVGGLKGVKKSGEKW